VEARDGIQEDTEAEPVPRETGRQKLSQGSLFVPLTSQPAFESPTDAVRQQPICMLLVTHPCDLWRDVDDVTVEALACYGYPSDHKELRNWTRSSPRRFPLDVLHDSAALVAHADHRVVYPKGVSSQFRLFRIGLPEARLQELPRWLARRFERPAHPEQFDREVGNPLLKALRDQKGGA